jgi:glucose/arabinose dehydrogenase
VRLVPLALTSLLAAAFAACGQDEVQPLRAATESGDAHHFDVRRVATGLNRPTYVGTAPGDPALWVLEQPGRVVRLHDGERATVLDIRDRVKTGAEQGLLGAAFHPDFATDRRLYLHWSDPEGDTRVAEFRAGAGGDGIVIDPQPLRELLFHEQPEENHNGGQLAFGPDGRLYLGLGDGGGGFDPRRTAQDPESLLGKVLSTDVDAPEPRWRVVLTGLRNPWRFSFDSALGEIWVADVGQDAVEEVNRVLLEPDEPPKNLGWSAYEGTLRVEEGGTHDLDSTGEVIWPVASYGHDDQGGCSITGGVVYRGTALPELSGRYVYGDFCTAALWSLEGTPEGRAADVRRERAKVPQLTHIGTDGDGELLFASATGAIYRAVPAGSR